MRCLLMASAVALTACGGGGGSPVAGPSSCLSRPVEIQLFGDSTMRPQGPNVQAFMDARFGAGAVRVEVRAVDGTGTPELLAGTDGLNRPWPQSVSADIVAINSGQRDALRGIATGIAQYKANLKLLAAAPADVVFVTPNATWAANRRPGYAEAMRVVAEEIGTPLADVDGFVRGLDGWEAMVPDGTHPDAKLLRLIADEVLGPALAERVALVRCK